MGPIDLPPGQGIDVRPHPHIALATVTYLFEGSLEHRDSLGSVREIRPGDVNWMSAGAGIAHSERTPRAARAAGPEVHGIQSWVALPDGHEDGEPSFVHYPSAVLPRRTLDGVELTMIVGRAWGLESPVATLWPTVYAELRFGPAAFLEVSADHDERAVYVVQGELQVGGATVRTGQLAVLEPGSASRVGAEGGGARAMLLGGARFPTRRYIWWNFVASSPERIERAKGRWRQGGFAPVPGDSEFIPLPEH